MDHVGNLYTMDVARKLQPGNLPYIKTLFDPKSYTELEKYVRKIERTEGGFYDWIKAKGMLPENVPREIYAERAAFSCRSVMKAKYSKVSI